MGAGGVEHRGQTPTNGLHARASATAGASSHEGGSQGGGASLPSSSSSLSSGTAGLHSTSHNNHTHTQPPCTHHQHPRPPGRAGRLALKGTRVGGWVSRVCGGRGLSAASLVGLSLTVGIVLLFSTLGSVDRTALAGHWQKVSVLGQQVMRPSASASARREVRCGGGRLRTQGLDPLHLLHPLGSGKAQQLEAAAVRAASIVRKGNLERLHEALGAAVKQQRPLRIGVLGGSFSAGGAVADYGDSYTEVLSRLLTSSQLCPYGVEVTNMAQGGAGFMLPLLCTDKVYSLVAADPEVRPDVWIVEFAENFDSSLEWYEALLAMLLWDKERFGSPAVLTAAVAKNACFSHNGQTRGVACGLVRTLPWLVEAAAAMDLPLVSFTHGVGAALGLDANGLLLNSTADVSGSSKEGALLEAVLLHLYADCGQNVHFNEYGHSVMGHFLFSLFSAASSFSTPFHGRLHELQDPSAKGLLLPQAMQVFSKLSSSSEQRTLSCNLTLTQGRANDLVPVASSNFTLWVEQVKEGNKIFASRTRADRKQTWTPSVENATLDFDFLVPPHASTLCVLMYGANGMFLEASFPGHETIAEPLDEEEEEGQGEGRGGSGVKCEQVQANGQHVDCSTAVPGAKGPEEQGRVFVSQRPSACMYRGGVDWTPYSVYKIACDCALPPALADNTTHTIRFRAVKGLVQIAGVVIW